MDKTVRRYIFGWEECDLNTYSHAYSIYGGSVCTHPDVLTYLAAKQEKKIKFFCKRKNGAVVSSTYSVNDSLSLYSKSHPFVFEDIILPSAPDCKLALPFKTKKLSPLQKNSFINSFGNKILNDEICHMKPEFSKKTIRKRNGERNRFLKLGGEIIDIQSLSSEMISDAYIKLFNARWSGKIRPFPRKNLLDAIEKFRPMIFGSALSINKEIIAIDLILKSECPEWIYFDDINGGYDPQYNEIGAGSILLWENYTRAKEICQSENKKIIFSLGKLFKGMEYKRQWCDVLPLRRVF
ncbi:transcriptional regulator [Enterobacter cloacae complex sp. 2024EL-00215]|uniref:Transcriptional regulator n=1 Tax=Enterobacter mori TaxID=539813 RepID=A0A7T0H2J5_9ENTR|nr:transcriptional regulator [Enterobacter mori]QPK02410.1 transcriptional regulator [Enterobacter mori]